MLVEERPALLLLLQGRLFAGSPLPGCFGLVCHLVETTPAALELVGHLVVIHDNGAAGAVVLELLVLLVEPSQGLVKHRAAFLDNLDSSPRSLHDCLRRYVLAFDNGFGCLLNLLNGVFALLHMFRGLLHDLFDSLGLLSPFLLLFLPPPLLCSLLLDHLINASLRLPQRLLRFLGNPAGLRAHCLGLLLETLLQLSAEIVIGLWCGDAHALDNLAHDQCGRLLPLPNLLFLTPPLRFGLTAPVLLLAPPAILLLPATSLFISTSTLFILAPPPLLFLLLTAAPVILLAASFIFTAPLLLNLAPFIVAATTVILNCTAPWCCGSATAWHAARPLCVTARNATAATATEANSECLIDRAIPGDPPARRRG
mmetsp:Transcript_91083/g.229675  ORF Transcript_91083/g.229675 Transcript_91083/m.229675 type:complete len:369 (+) Transcript_91083:1877-2983(+)